MLRPSLEEVKALAKQYNTIPVFYEFSADNQTPLNIYRAFSQESRNSFILESVTACSGPATRSLAFRRRKKSGSPETPLKSAAARRARPLR